MFCVLSQNYKLFWEKGSILRQIVLETKKKKKEKNGTEILEGPSKKAVLDLLIKTVFCMVLINHSKIAGPTKI